MNPLPEFEQEMVSTRKVLERIPAEKFAFTPHPKSKPMIWLANHVATLPNWGTTTMNTEKLVLDSFTPPPQPTTTEELLAIFDKNVAECRDALAGVTDEALQQPWSLVFKGEELMTMPRAGVLRSVFLNHLIHHRAQLTMYMRMADIAVPGMYGPSADDPNMFAEASA